MVLCEQQVRALVAPFVWIFTYRNKQMPSTHTDGAACVHSPAACPALLQTIHSTVLSHNLAVGDSWSTHFLSKAFCIYSGT